MLFRTIFIGVGSNLGDRKETIESAQQVFSQSLGIRLIRSAPLYETEPVGGPAQGLYLNTVWEVETSLQPREILDLVLQIESQFGRNRKEKNEPRTIDLDILFFDDEIIEEPDLVVPHPRLHERWFVLKPLWDLRADFVHPIFKKSICELLDQVNAAHRKH